MDSDLVSSEYADEDYIDMEVSCHQNLLCHSITSPPRPTEFEFQMFSSSSERETTTSPADELFYKGKLLPLHLPPRFQMVEKLLQDKNKDNLDEFFSTPLATNTNTTPTSNTPFESCNVSPSQSCQVSRELIGENPKKSLTRKLGSKLKASRAYIKSLFTKSGCSVPKAKESILSNNMKTPFGHIQKHTYEMPTAAIRSFNKEKFAKDRRSFSGAIKRFSSSSSLFSSGSSSSSNSSSFHESLQSHHRSSEIENPIQSAIAHCKRSPAEIPFRKDDK